MGSMQLEQVLSRPVLSAGRSWSAEEYVVGRYRTLRIRVRGDVITDVHDYPLTVEEIHSETDR